MCIVRIPKRNTHFVQIDNNSLSDPSLSMKAKGLLSYLLSCSDNWIIRISHLMKHFSDGKTAIRSALKELETCGYLKRERVNEKGHIEWRQTVYESPALNPDWIPAKDSRPTAPAQHSTPSKQTELLDVPASSKKENEPPVPQVKKEKPQQTLSFKLDFSEQQKEVMSSMLKGIDNAQQLILVLEQMVNQNEIKNPVAYLAGIIKKYRANQFTPLEEEKQKAAAEREAKRKAGVKDCPYCHVDDGFVVFEEPNGHKSSRLCNHDEAGILKTARDLDAKIVTSKIIKENEPPAKAEQNVPVVLIPVSQDLGFDDEIEVERQAGIKDCPFCDDNGVISYQEETGEISSDPCFHNAGDILRNARDAQAVIITAKPGYRGYKEELLPALPEQQFNPLEEEKREAKRKAADCPYCHVDDGFVCFEEPNGHRRSRLCDHDEAGILRTARELDAKIVSAKLGCKEDLSKPERSLEEKKIDFFNALEKWRRKCIF